MQIIVKQELKSLIPPLSAEEFSLLEQSIIAEGCRDPLIIWVHGNENILVDGHNRYEICKNHGIEFKTSGLVFDNQDAVEDWMDANQLGRRNLSPDAFKLLLGRRYNRVKKQGIRNDLTSTQIDEKSKITTVNQNDERLTTAEKLAKEHSVSKATVERAGKFAKEVESTPELKEAIKTGRPVLQVKRELKEKAREERRQENRAKIESVKEPCAIVDNQIKFSTIVIDPPWDWGDEGDVDQMGRSKPDYSTMSYQDLLGLDVGKNADIDCHIYLWITNRSLPKGFSLLEKWGFRYITALTWVKPSFGMGNYFRGQTEHVLFGVKGSQPLKRKDIGTVFNAPRGKGGHSSKPIEFYDLVESCSHGPYLEMFSRSERDGWVMWGENAAH